LINRENLARRIIKKIAHAEYEKSVTRIFQFERFFTWVWTGKKQEKAIDLFFIGIILLSFCSAVNRKLDYKFLNIMIVFLFLFNCCLGFLIILKILKQISGSKLMRTALALGLLTSVLFATSLGFIRLLTSFRDISWNVDSRLFLSQSYSYIQNGNSNDSNSYSGFDIQYHATPSYIAAQVFDYLKVNPSITLFIAIPLLTLLTIYTFAESLLRGSGLNEKHAILGAVLLINISYMTSMTQRHKAMSPLVNSELMLNSQLAIAVVLATLGIQVTKLRWRNLIVLAGLISLVALKPQYLPFAALSLTIITVINSPKKCMKSVLRASLPILINSALALSFLLYFTSSKIGYRYIAKLDRDDLKFFLRSNLLMILFAFLLFVFLKIINESLTRVKVIQLFSTIGIYLLFALLLDLVKFEPSERTMERMQIFQSTEPGGDSDFNQGLILLYVLVAVSFLKLIPTLEIKKAIAVKVACIFLISFSIVRIVYSVPSFLDPSTRGYEAVDLASLRQVLAEAEKRTDRPKFLVNDFVDPAEEYRRNGSGMYWSSVGIGEFYLSDIKTFHFLAPDVEERLVNTNFFFNSHISDFHSKFIKSAEIDFIVINKRCLPNWFFETRPIFSNSEYALISPESFSPDNYQKNYPKNNNSQVRKFGTSPCM
jgi:hypothetical protein